MRMHVGYFGGGSVAFYFVCGGGGLFPENKPLCFPQPVRLLLRM